MSRPLSGAGVQDTRTSLAIAVQRRAVAGALTLRGALRRMSGSAGHAWRGTVRPPVTGRGIAQSGSAPALGAGCRGFESLYPDHPSRPGQLSCALAPVAQPDRAPAF